MNKARNSGVTNAVQPASPMPPMPPAPPPPPPQPAPITSAKQAQQMDDLREYAQRVLNIRLSKTLDAIDFNTVKLAVESVEKLQSDIGTDIGLNRIEAHVINNGA